MVRPRLAPLILVLTLLGWVVTGSPASAAPPYLSGLNIPYGTSGQILDVYRPVEGAGHPMVIFIHGGGWRTQNKDSLADIGKVYAANGITSLMIDFRQAPEHPFPAAWDDVREAVRFARVNARALRGDPEKIVLLGFSSGANLAAMAGLHDSVRVRGLVLGSGIYDLDAATNPLLRADIAGYMGSTPWAYGSPINLVSAGDPPTLIQIGTRDDLVVPAEAQRMAQALIDHQVPTVVKTYDTDHGLDPTNSLALWDELFWVLQVTS